MQHTTYTDTTNRNAKITKKVTQENNNNNVFSFFSILILNNLNYCEEVDLHITRSERAREIPERSSVNARMNWIQNSSAPTRIVRPTPLLGMC